MWKNETIKKKWETERERERESFKAARLFSETKNALSYRASLFRNEPFSRFLNHLSQIEYQ